jgi:hypothetical protein
MLLNRDAAWQQWFDTQYDLTRMIVDLIQARTAGRSDTFKAAVIFSIIEGLAEEVRGCLILPDGDGKEAVDG